MDRNRFWNEFKVVVANNWKQDLGLLGVIFFSTIAFIVVMMSGLFGEDGMSLAARAETAIELSSMVALVAKSYCAAMVFGDLSNKTVQISTMMNPASVSEKFWTRILHSVLMVVVLSELVTYAAVGLWLLFQTDDIRMQTYEHLLGLKNSNVSLISSMAGTMLLYIMSFVSSCSFVAAYAVGATYFRKHPFLHTTLVMISVFLVICIGLGFFVGIYMTYCDKKAVIPHLPDAHTVIVALTVFFMVSCVLLLRWAYCRFSKLQYKTR